MGTKATKLQLRTILWAAFALLLAMSLVMPLLAQDTSQTLDGMSEDDNATIVVGIYGHNENGDLIVTSDTGDVYIIAPAGAFRPSDYQDGDLVIVIGRELPDGETIQAMDFALFEDDGTAEATPEATMEATDEATAEATPEATAEATDEPTQELTACESRNHPVAARIAEQFDVSTSDVMAMHCAGNGFGNIARAFLLGDKLGMDPQSFLDAHHSGMGWGQIVKASGIHPSELAPGRIGKSKFSDDSLTSSTHGNGKNKDKANRGNGNNGNHGNNGNNGNRGNSGNKGGKK